MPATVASSSGSRRSTPWISAPVQPERGRTSRSVDGVAVAVEGMPPTVKKTNSIVKVIITRAHCSHEPESEETTVDLQLTGKRAIVTGASAGIGIETARAFAGAGAQGTLAVRNTEAGA